MKNFIEYANEISKELNKIRHELHENAEPSRYEKETANIIIRELNKIPEVKLKTGLGNGGYGIIADIEGNNLGKKVALRADMDALSITENTGLDYTSKNQGIMHACGHDTHVTMLIGAIKILAKNKENLNGSFRFIFQPAEELSPDGGAKSMIEEGALIDVDAIFGLHVWPELEFGKIGIKSGPLMAASDHFIVDIKGKSSHAAGPESGIDAIVAGAQFINGIQQIVNRNIDPLKSAVITAGTFQSGTRYNIIAESCKIEGTCRTLNPEIRDLIEKRLDEVLQGVCIMTGCVGKLDYQRGYMSLINETKSVEYIEKNVLELFGEEYLEIIENPVMKAEDFSFYLDKVKGAFIWLGTGIQGEDNLPLHNSKFAPKDDILWRGSALLAKLAADYE